jgi:hypothetical protein
VSEPAELAALAVADWSRLVRGYADAAAVFASEGDRAPAYQMCERMLVRAAKEGAGALAWAHHPLALPALVAGAGRRVRAQLAALAELATVPVAVPVAFAQVHRAFADDEAREPALVAMFLEAARKAELLVEQLALAGQTELLARDAADRLERALPRAHLHAFRPRIRTVADFDRVRATGYTDAPARLAGRVAEVTRPGLAWYGHVLRKADVIVFETAP